MADMDEKKTVSDEETSSPQSLSDAPIESKVHYDEGHDSAPVEDTTVEISKDEYPSGFRLIVLTGSAFISFFLIALDQTIVGTAVPYITDQFHSLGDVSWYAAAYFMTFGAAQTSAGKIYTYFNLKWSFFISLFIFEIGSLICAVAPSSKALVAGRAIAGLGAAGLSVGSTSIVSLTVPPAKRPMMKGVLGMIYCVAAVLGPIIGGAFTDKVTWRWCFYINLPIGGLSGIAVFFFFHLPAAAAPPNITLTKKLLHIDPIGVALAMGGITCFILALQYGGITYPWNSSIVIGLLVGFVLLAIALILWEIWLGDFAMMLPRLYKSRSLSATAPYQFFFMGAYIILLYYLPIYFQSILGASPIQSGVNNLPLVLAAGVFSLVGGAVVMQTGRAQQVMSAGSMVGTVAIGLLYTLDIGTPTSKWVGYQFFIGATMSFAILHGLTVVQAYVGPEDIPTVTANLLFFHTLGGAFSTSAGQSAFLNRLIATLPNTAPGVSASLVIATGASDLHNVFSPDVLPGVLEAYMVGLKAAFAVAIAFSGTAFLITFLIPMRKLPSHQSGADAPMAMA